MNDSVRYQIERAEDALRTALKLGAETEDPYLLRNISETINTIKNWRGSFRYNITKETTDQGIKFDLYSSGLDEIPYNYISSGVRGGMSDDVITFSQSWRDFKNPGGVNDPNCLGMTLKAPWSGYPPFLIVSKMNEQFPSKIQQVKNLANTVGNVVSNAAQGNGVFVPDSVKVSRMNICSSCPHFSRSDIRCRHCGCYLESKTALRASKCPIDKWSFHLTDR